MWQLEGMRRRPAGAVGHNAPTGRVGRSRVVCPHGRRGKSGGMRRRPAGAVGRYAPTGWVGQSGGKRRQAGLGQSGGARRPTLWWLRRSGPSPTPGRVRTPDLASIDARPGERFQRLTRLAWMAKHGTPDSTAVAFRGDCGSSAVHRKNGRRFEV